MHLGMELVGKVMYNSKELLDCPPYCFYILTSFSQASPDPHQHLLFSLIPYSHLSECEVVSQCRFNLYFPSD